MAGKIGMKGGGGKRPGAGRPPAQREKQEDKFTLATPGDQTPLEFLLTVMNDNEVEDKLRIAAATTAAQYVHAKKGEGGKKEAEADAAKKVAGGKFAAATPPKLVAAGGRKL